MLEPIAVSSSAHDISGMLWTIVPGIIQFKPCLFLLVSERTVAHYIVFLIVLWFLSVNRYNKPLQASVHAVTDGTLWALKREDFRGILMSEFSNLSSLKLLRSVELFSRLTILQLSHIAEHLMEVTFSDGQIIIDKVPAVTLCIESFS